MGKLFANFEPYDVQVTRREARKETKMEEREKGMRCLVSAVKQLSGSMDTAVLQLVIQYDLDEADAKEKVKLYW